MCVCVCHCVSVHRCPINSDVLCDSVGELHHGSVANIKKKMTYCTLSFFYLQFYREDPTVQVLVYNTMTIKAFKPLRGSASREMTGSKGERCNNVFC